MRGCEYNACCAQGCNSRLEQCNRKQKLNQELNHKCNPDELAKSYVQWKNSNAIRAIFRLNCWPVSIPPKIGSKAGVFFNVSGNPRLHADRPVGTCNRRWRQPLNQTQKLTCNAQSDMFAQCTCNAMKKLLQPQSKKLMQQNSQFSHSSFSLFFLLEIKLPQALTQFQPKRSRFLRFLKSDQTCNVKQFLFGFNGLDETDLRNAKYPQSRVWE